MEVLETGILLAEDVKGDRKDCANQEAVQQPIVHGPDTEHPGGPEGTPEDTGSEEGVDTRASEVIRLGGATYSRDLSHLVVENGRANETRNDCCNDLSREGDTGRNVNVMGQLQILSEVDRVGSRDVTIRLEVVHGCCVSSKPETAKQLGENVERNLDIRDGLDNSNRNTEDDSEEDTIKHNGRGSVCGPNSNTCGTDTNTYDQDTGRDLGQHLTIQAVALTGNNTTQELPCRTS